jgi:hypothetical protein
MKVKYCLYLIKYHEIKASETVTVQLRLVLTSVLDEGKWRAPRTGRLIPE